MHIIVMHLIEFLSVFCKFMEDATTLWASTVDMFFPATH